MVKNKLLQALSQKNVEKIALEILNRICEGNTDDNCLDYDFELNQGNMKSDNVNTNFKFDIRKKSILDKVQQILYTEENITEENTQHIIDFLKNIKDVLNKKYKSKLSEAIRQTILGGADKKAFPLDDIEVVNIEIGSKPEVDYVLVIQKMTPKYGQTPRVNENLIQEHEKTGKPLEEIIQEKKEQGDERYKYVTGAYKRKWFFDCQVDIFVNYSLSPIK